MPIPAPKKVSVSEARASLADLLAAVDAGEGLRVVVERYGKPLAVIVHPDEMAALDAIEDRYVQLETDRLRAEGKLDDGQRLTTEQVAKHLAEATAAETLAAAVQRSSARISTFEGKFNAGRGLGLKANATQIGKIKARWKGDVEEMKRGLRGSKSRTRR